jgi:hypothetical protein
MCLPDSLSLASVLLSIFTFALVSMSALPLKADIRRRELDARFWPKADIRIVDDDSAGVPRFGYSRHPQTARDPRAIAQAHGASGRYFCRDVRFGS